MGILKKLIRKIIPERALDRILPIYHYALALGGAMWYRFPSRSLTVIGVTGTKGKTSTIEILNAILEEAGYSTAIVSTLRFKAGEINERNMHKMTMPGRFFIQRHLRTAVKEGCDCAIVEMTSQGVLQHRHRFISMDALLVTNISPEHIEAHGSYEAYVSAKLVIARALVRSHKPTPTLIVNADDEASEVFLSLRPQVKLTYSHNNVKPYVINETGITFTLGGVQVRSYLRGNMNLSNILAAITYAQSIGIETSTIRDALKKLHSIRGRVEFIDEGQPFDVVVDYAHTPDSLRALYKTFPNQHKICVLGNTGGGRDTWKRPEMARIAEQYCAHIILTNEDPYDENPRDIIDDMAHALTIPKYEVEMDRRKAIQKAVTQASDDAVVLITGKGTDPYIMGPQGTKMEWDDARVTREELQNMMNL